MTFIFLDCKKILHICEVPDMPECLLSEKRDFKKTSSTTASDKNSEVTVCLSSLAIVVMIFNIISKRPSLISPHTCGENCLTFICTLVFYYENVLVFIQLVNYQTTKLFEL